MESKKINRFLCMDCGVCTSKICEYYMVHDKIWNSVVEKSESHRMLCIECLENRLKRKLTASDFTSAPINDISIGMGLHHSDRLKNRITSYGYKKMW